MYNINMREIYVPIWEKDLLGSKTSSLENKICTENITINQISHKAETKTESCIIWTPEIETNIPPTQFIDQVFPESNKAQNTNSAFLISFFAIGRRLFFPDKEIINSSFIDLCQGRRVRIYYSIKLNDKANNNIYYTYEWFVMKRLTPTEKDYVKSELCNKNYKHFLKDSGNHLIIKSGVNKNYKNMLYNHGCL
ncbi:hypothetical protein [Candidatus Nesciobacter abundans]|uniref:Uncharacterized protein n=1 Tax=Candidatus Nesciobacter abundans TaxID=2601668 RepID=A0A5C0UHE3_9PROT|nr:hypothetical protein [Candidatus Nesciobacter abundans]QEK38973.1 hypothetical protein FZC36_00790 [Candidatus Nesciobacter abundans]